MLKIVKWSSYYFKRTWVLLLEFLHFLPLIDRKIDFHLILITGDSLYLKVQGTRENTSSYQYFEIANL